MDERNPTSESAGGPVAAARAAGRAAAVGPLSGLKVVELGQVLAGPFAGAIFADLGADVVKVERPEGGDDGRQMGPAFRYGDALSFQVFNRGKQSVTLDLKDAHGVAALHELLADADVLVHNLRPGVTEQLGIDGATLCARHPRLVYCEMSAFGHPGPNALRPGYEPLIQAYSGLSTINGGPDDPPMRAGASLCDQGAGMWVVIGALSLLQRRQHIGRGGIVSASLLETALGWLAQKTDAYLNEGKLPERHRTGHPSLVPYEAFEASDGPFLICAGNDRLFEKLAGALDQPQWARDERYRTNRARLQNKATLLPAMNAVLATRPREHWLRVIDAVGVPCSPINTVPEVLREPHVESLAMVQAVPGEDFRLTGLPLSFDGERPALRARAPLLGEHNARVGTGGAGRS